MTESSQIIQNPNKSVFNDTMFILTNIVYALNIFTSFFVGGLIFIGTIILYFRCTEILSKDHLKFIIKTHLVSIFIGLGILLWSGSLDFWDSLMLAMDLMPDEIGEEAAAKVLSTNDIGFKLFFSVMALGVMAWFYTRIIGGWVALLQKKPIEGHFGIRLRKRKL